MEGCYRAGEAPRGLPSHRGGSSRLWILLETLPGVRRNRRVGGVRLDTGMLNPRFGDTVKTLLFPGR